MTLEQKLARRMKRLGTETAFEVLARARVLEGQGKEIIHLEIGEPDFATPANIEEAAIKALREGYTHYGPSVGQEPLREAIAAYITRHRHLATSPEEVVVTPGGKPIMFYLIMALLDEGDEAIYPNPGFPIYESMINFVGGKAIAMRLQAEREWRPDLEELGKLITERTKLLILNSPHNPTGGILTAEDLQQIADLAIKHDLIVLSDEIYSELIYEGAHSSIAALPGMKERTIILDGFSKTYAMTGWRLGYGVMPPWLVAPISQLITNSVSCTSSFSQMAGIEALNGSQEEVQKMRRAFKGRRDFLLAGLNSIQGISCVQPTGAFYAFPSVRGLKIANSKAFADLLLTDYGVATLSGTAFGEYGEGYLRLSYANSRENLQKALERLEAAVEKVGLR